MCTSVTLFCGVVAFVASVCGGLFAVIARNILGHAGLISFIALKALIRVGVALVKFGASDTGLLAVFLG